MTKQAIQEMFIAGNVLTVTFNIRKTYYDINGHRISQGQFSRLTNDLKGKYDYQIIGGGLTKHIYQYKP